MKKNKEMRCKKKMQKTKKVKVEINPYNPYQKVRKVRIVLNASGTMNSSLGEKEAHIQASLSSLRAQILNLMSSIKL
jgi:hypothetical protein